ncbi:uncharacterized protein EV154DRAFT_569723 [Mucor mucedo]|uniref:uncharacterized protein n=1 Tax=Mucor mucedo TaxID=29922 RepID=UPI00221EBADC|nr:uncharacterized protein EV154DRAFT_569723 [Mucor mucedo]KAI7874436.1 hypothetical protein EV154DRAFT_569723 [Mucor mucedo]
MVTAHGKDIWVGDLVENNIGNCYLLSKFVTVAKPNSPGNHVVCEAFEVLHGGLSSGNHMPFLDSNTNFGIVPEKHYLAVDHIDNVISKLPNFKGDGCTVEYNTNGEICLVAFGLNGDIYNLWNGLHFSTKFKRVRPSSPNVQQLMKVIISPIILWSDDTSGNKSKQYNVFDSYLMYLAAMPMEERNHRENTMFICTSDKNLKAVNMVSSLVDDLAKLEDGIEVYSYDHGEYILLVAPLLLLTADNPRHSELAMHKGTNARHPCRACLRPKPKKLSDLLRSDEGSDVAYISHDYPKRRLEDLHEVVQCKVNDPQRFKMLDQTYSFSVNGSEAFLRLNAFDPTRDCPVEVLHTVSLGCVKYLVDYLTKTVLSPSEIVTLDAALQSSRNRDAYPRTFRRSLRHSGSFVGRDYKQLVQVLPTVLNRVFTDENQFGLFKRCFTSLAKLCSLIYIRGVESNFDKYILWFENALKDFTYHLYGLDNSICQTTQSKPPLFSLRPKVHMLYHLLEDIKRFGCPLQYETESSEQFNKFIREHLFMTNRQYTSRDVAKRFGKQFICRQIFNGFSFNYTKEWKENGFKYVKVVRGETGIAIKAMQSENSQFKKHFFGARKNISDSYYVSKTVIVAGLTGLFQTETGLSLGRVEEDDNKVLHLYKYLFVKEGDLGEGRWLSTVQVDRLGNVLIHPSNIVPVGKDWKCKDVMDFGFIFDQQRDIRLINISKFGTYWSLIVNLQ